jgi:hypothetical protein
MVRKPFAAFGRVLYANYYEAGYTADTTTFANSKTVLMFTEGSITVRDKQTGEIADRCVPGWIRNGQYEDRVFACTADAPSVSWCYDPKVNQNYVPVIELLALKQGESAVLPQGTALFLCHGALAISGASHEAPRQIAVRSGDTTVTASTDVYGLIFK